MSRQLFVVIYFLKFVLSTVEQSDCSTTKKPFFSGNSNAGRIQRESQCVVINLFHSGTYAFVCGYYYYSEFFLNIFFSPPHMVHKIRLLLIINIPISTRAVSRWLVLYFCFRSICRLGQSVTLCKSIFLAFFKCFNPAVRIIA